MHNTARLCSPTPRLYRRSEPGRGHCAKTFLGAWRHAPEPWRTNVQWQPGLSTSYVTVSSTPPEPRVPDQSRPTTTTTQSRQSTAALISSWTRQFCSTPCNDYPQHGLTDFGCSTVCSQACHSS